VAVPIQRDSETTSADGRLTALLGPTNTGKTHRAIERMLDFDSGVMGLPLRLLAREVYDRVSARIGEQAVALVTGEEKRVPARPRYWICTTEAMPLDLRADFVAVDEIQLVGHPERGHVFTDRLLHARGRVETWFLGSSTVEALVRSQLPDVRIVKLPRLSRLLHKGQSSLRTLPRRSAVVAFSMPEVYELADALRRRRGGAAVVLGALSPRVRNAQVALYQAGEVDFLVATDAIGMGLNLDIDHVALAGTRKFDGFESRDLEGAELAQIVGRAGRHLRDGTFGTLAPEPELSRGLVQQLEQHRFAPQQFAYYRNSSLDFSSLAALLSSLARRPPRAGLRSVPDADDVLVLRALAKRPEVAARSGDPTLLRTLWEVCRIPNYEKRIPEHQAERLAPLFQQLSERGRIASEYVDAQLRNLERYDGDIHTLMDRLSAVRTFTYVSHQGGWLEQQEEFRLRTRAVEDRLSDALHERLLERFVEPAERRRTRSLSKAERADQHHPFARLALLDVGGSDAEPRSQIDWVERLVSADYQELLLDPAGELWFDGERVARLARGQSLLRPELKLVLSDAVDAGARSRIERRLRAHTRDLVNSLLEPLALAVSDSAPLRGLSYQLEQGLGTVLKRDASAQLAGLSDQERALLVQREIVVGRHTVYAAPLLASERLTVREALCRAQLGREAAVGLPSTQLLYQRLAATSDRELALRVGFVPLASWAVRCDVLERLAALPPEAAREEAMLMLGASEEEARGLLRELPRGRKRRRRKRA
jgi:ATP-dependent RNA helicase SUPV3L1/SUV3